ncbi:HD domain-containing protein [bacterium]|jgi:uncharacterized protein|nr:HD domain-containing protein [bacterium]MBT5015582.1 HD domain-containing protein [bacterium]
MNKSEVIEKTREFVRKEMEGEGSGHDWWHIDRVTKTALTIGKEEKADLFIVELGALLHDIADQKFHNGDETVGPRVATQWLESLNTEQYVIDAVCQIIKDISYKGANTATPMKTLEGQIVQDADRLDALGAVGIARCFAYGGHKQQPIHSPDINPINHATFEEYKKTKTTSINHFYEKLLLLKDRINTESGKKIAQERDLFMQQFLDQFFAESEGLN